MIITIDSRDIAESCSPYKILKVQSPYQVFRDTAWKLIGYGKMDKMMAILRKCYPNAFAMRMLLRLLYANPSRSDKELDNFDAILAECGRSKKSVAKQMVKFTYNDLPTMYRSCLLYLTIFPRNDCIMRRTTVSRRWIAEGLIATGDRAASAVDRSESRTEYEEAACCFDALLARGLISAREISAAGKIKSFTIHHVVRGVITRIARDVNFVGRNLPPNLAHHLSIHSRVGLQVSSQPGSNGIVEVLPYLAKSSQWQILKVLDLECCKDLKKHHLKSICKIILLKYLSLRNTDVTELPKQIEKLQCLETLDIRQTAVTAFPRKSIMLPMLKHLLAGRTDSPSNNSDKFQESFTTVCLPSGSRRMEKLETLSHVEVSHNVDDLSDIGKLLQLRKLGVILHGKKGDLGLLFQQIEKLQSLSIRINQPTRSEGTLAPPPKLLQSLNIGGIPGGLPLWIAELDQLTKLTLSKTDLGEDAMRLLGKLGMLRCLRLQHRSCLRLQHRSCVEQVLTFEEKEFKSLTSLVVEGSNITNITFDAGAAPKLKMIVWSFVTMNSLSGVNHLPKLRKLELNGDCNTYLVRQEIEEHPNHPDFKHNGLLLCQEAASTIEI